MSTLLTTLPPTVALLLLCAVVWWRTAAVLDALARFSGAILATITAEDPLPPDPTAGRVLDAQNYTDEELTAAVQGLMFEVRRRENGGHAPEEQP